jgi:hypothetical protein
MFNKKSRLNYRLKDKEIYSLISKSSIFLLLMVHAKKMEIKIMFCSVKNRNRLEITFNWC